MTANSFHAFSAKQEPLEIIRECEDVGFKIDGVLRYGWLKSGRMEAIFSASGQAQSRT